NGHQKYQNRREPRRTVDENLLEKLLNDGCQLDLDISVEETEPAGIFSSNDEDYTSRHTTDSVSDSNIPFG
ncbi:hypothetical protein HHI36_002033, partial [Cryptolaemus montrouzieri]